MRFLALALTLIVSARALALEPAEFVQNFPTQSQFERAGAAYDLCENIFAGINTPGYTARLQQLDQLYNVAPEAAYLALSTCQSMWVSKFLDPVKLAGLRGRDRSKIAFLISGADLLISHLSEEVRLYLQILPKDKTIPSSPFEILSHRASTESQLNETLHREMRASANSILAMGGGLAAALKATKSFASFTASASQTIGKVVKQSLLVTVFALGAGELAELGLSEMRRSTLANDAESLAVQLTAAQGAQFSLLLDEFYKAEEHLGFFYNYDLYLAESGAGQSDLAVLSTKCLAQIKEFFAAGKNVQPCRDAATTWVLAAQFLASRFPDNKEARAVADRLMVKAKRALWRQLEAEAYRNSLPVCRPTVGPTLLFAPSYECTDSSGNVVI